MDSETEAATSGVEATVIELLPNATCRLRLDDRKTVLAHASGAAEKNFVRIRVGDRVLVQLSRNDPARGRVRKLIEKV